MASSFFPNEKNRLGKYRYHYQENPRVELTGENFGKLQKEMNERRPEGLVKIPSAQRVNQVLACVRCGEIPDPNNLMACPEGHYTCGDCAFQSKPTIRGGAGGNGKDFLEPCCRDICNLRKEPPHLLKVMLDNALYRCGNHKKGCMEMVMGYEKYQEHKINCQITFFYKCRFHRCNERRMSVEELLLHYVKDHGGHIFELKGDGGLILPIELEELMAQRLCAILKVKGTHFIFACEVRNDIVYIWIWDLEHGEVGSGKMTEVWYHLRLKQARKLPFENFQDLREFKGRCLFHAVDPREIFTPAKMLEAFKMDLESFKKMFIERTADGGGRWAVTIWVKNCVAKNE